MKNVVFSIYLLLLSGLPVITQDFFLKDDSLVGLLKNRNASISVERIHVISELMALHLPDEAVYDSLMGKMIEEAEDSRNMY